MGNCVNISILPKTKSVISVENVVATGNLSQSIDLVEIKDNFEETEYNPDRFPGLVFRLPSPKTSTLIFRTGKWFVLVLVLRKWQLLLLIKW